MLHIFILLISYPKHLLSQIPVMLRCKIDFEQIVAHSLKSKFSELLCKCCCALVCAWFQFVQTEKSFCTEKNHGFQPTRSRRPIGKVWSTVSPGNEGLICQPGRADNVEDDPELVGTVICMEYRATPCQRSKGIAKDTTKVSERFIFLCKIENANQAIRHLQTL